MFIYVWTYVCHFLLWPLRMCNTCIWKVLQITCHCANRTTDWTIQDVILPSPVCSTHIQFLHLLNLFWGCFTVHSWQQNLQSENYMLVVFLGLWKSLISSLHFKHHFFKQHSLYGLKSEIHLLAVYDWGHLAANLLLETLDFCGGGGGCTENRPSIAT